MENKDEREKKRTAADEGCGTSGKPIENPDDQIIRNSGSF
jgi:hypothetical protein